MEIQLDILKTAIQLKMGIDNIPKIFEPVGSCSYDVYKYEHENSDESDEESDRVLSDESQRTLNDIENDESDESERTLNDIKVDYLNNLKLKQLVGIQKIKSVHNFESNFNITIFGEDYQINKIDQNTLKTFFEKATPATYGDMKTLSTMNNPEVRLARDIPYKGSFSDASERTNKDILNWFISEWTLNFLSGLWDTKFNEKVNIVPYKINLYNTGGHFKPHKDTPDKNLIGSMIIKLGDYSSVECQGGLLRITDKYTGENHVMDFHGSDPFCLDKKDKINKDPNIYMFYSDCVHEVTPVEGNWIRGTIAFKVYLKEGQVNPNEPELNSEVLKQVINRLEFPFGIILSYEYSYNTNNLKYNDQLLLDVISKLGLKYELHSILESFNGTSTTFEGESGENSASSKIYLLDTEHINYVINPINEKPILPYEDLVFYRLQEGVKWKHEEDPGAAYTGNESRPSEIDSIYISKALIIYVPD